MKKKSFYFLNFSFSFFFFTLLLLSCSSEQEVIEASHPDGSPKVVGLYQNNFKKGEIKFYEDGKKEIEGGYNENLERDGRWTYWFSNGKVWSECSYKNGLKDGKSAVYFENGQKRYEGRYRNDTTIGTWKFWNERGELLKEIKY